MYDRAPRALTKPQESTAPTVGPGSYEPMAPAPSKVKADGYAPFSSMTTRETFLEIQDSVIAAPGPGHYDHMSDLRITGGHSLANRSQRFENPNSKTPGPGTYNLSKKSDWIKKNDVQASGREAVEKGGSLNTSRIRYSRKPQAPSIPTPGQAYGYEEREDGTLKKQDPPSKDESRGPAYYAPAHQETKTTAKYKGVHFGSLTSNRMDFDGRAGPGPGEYDPYTAVDKSLELLNAASASRDTSRAFESKLPRYHEMVVHQEEKKAVPGPGKYEINSQFDKRPQAVNTEGMEVDHPPFMSQSKRFVDKKHIAPAPGTYNDPRHALEALKKIRGLKRSPFGQTAVRFTPQPHIQKTPGPGSYSFTGLANDSLRKAYVESTRRGAFGSTSVRIKPMTRREDTSQPGPAQYQIKSRPQFSRYSQNVTANFASQTERLHTPPPIIKENPPPGSYEVSRSFDISQGKKDPAAPRTETGKRKKGSFLSSSTRFAPPRDIRLEKPEPNNPGPGTYNAPTKGCPTSGLMVTRDRRFKEKKNEYPGPGTYELSPLLQDTVLKGTFNATLNNPVAPQAEITRTNSVMQKQAFVLGV